MTVSPFQVARQKMVECQLVPGNILNEDVLEALLAIPREQFVPPMLQGSAYVDEDLRVAEGRYLLAPLVLAKMLVLADVQPEERVLDIACGSGYSTAVLARLARKVVAVEEQMELAERARQQLNRLGAANAEVITGPLAPGYPSAGPYDVIFINGAVQQLPTSLTDQLAENGRLVTVRYIAAQGTGTAGLGKVTLYRKDHGRIAGREMFDAGVPLLRGFEEKKHFQF